MQCGGEARNDVGGSGRSAPGASGHMLADASVPDMCVDNGPIGDEFDPQADVRHFQPTAKARILEEVFLLNTCT